MFSNFEFKGDEIYRGAVPFFLINNNKKQIYVCSSNKNIEDYYYAIKDFSDISVLKIENFNYSQEEFRNKNFELIEALQSGGEFILLLSLQSLFQEYFMEADFLEFVKDFEYSLSDIIEFLEKNNFKKSYLVEEMGQYSRRGDILDIFPPNLEHPIRMEFFGEYLENLRYFETATQRSVSVVDRVEIFSNYGGNKRFALLDLVSKSCGKEVEIYLENQELLQYKLEEYILRDRENEYIHRGVYQQVLEKSRIIETVRFSNEELEQYKDYEFVKKMSKEKNVYLLTEESMRFEEIFSGYPINIVKDPHYEGFKYGDDIVLTDRELKGIRVKRSEKRRDGVKFANINQIRSGDYIIHEQHGVGVFLGIELIDQVDYIAIRYADEDKLYVPVDGLSKLEKYIHEPGKIPDIYKLGRKGFKKKRDRLRKDIMEFAKELLEIQAKRNAANGFKFSKDTIWQEEFEEGFPYDETKDQLKAIMDVKTDMESHRIMDRIVCGDVGYGKTEVAMRASFKAIMDGKQVAILAPTTVLANQHYERFVERFKNFPVEIELLSRLKSPKEQKEISKKMSSGMVDLVIGTHRILSEDIAFKDLALLIIDEEQKFGVKAKEKLKKMKAGVDILTLTATPIPRTLNLALLGIRDISIIQTAPSNRLPIETRFISSNKDDIKAAVLHEISREGQVFYLFNSVKRMNSKLSDLEKLLPKYVKVVQVHGQMPSQEIKKRIREFENREADVLLSTTIIENGIDIENANTIIIENFDKLGLSQVYQLRGRVGRGGRKAYCYLVVEENRKLSKKGDMKRGTLESLGDLGVGFQLSLEDMKIRGAGEILGEKQHGAIETFGYDLYMKMLDEEIKKLKNEKSGIEDVYIDINKRGYIPKTYIEDHEKVVVYKKLLLVDSVEELEKIKEELRDRFGKYPSEVAKLFDYLEIKILCREAGIESLAETDKGYLVKINQDNVNFEKLSELMNKGDAKYIQSQDALLLSMDIKEFLNFYTKESLNEKN